MKQFMDKEFMLQNETAKRLFHSYAENMPVIDYHCHISPREIFEDRRFNNIAEVWLGGRNADGTYFGDHYKWRLMRSMGISEDLITGDADPRDKFRAFAKTLEMAIGNPMYHWCNLELHKYFGIDEPLTSDNTDKIWEITKDKLQNDPDLTVRGIIRSSNVYYIGSTDDPVDSLEWHEKIAADSSIEFKVCPSFRPDKAINISKDGFEEYVEKLAASVNKSKLTSAKEMCNALSERLQFFINHGCKASDHGLDYVMYNLCTMDEANEIFAKKMNGKAITKDEAEKYQTTILMYLAKQYHKNNIVMEIHYSCLRNVNKRMFDIEGPDTGFDVIAQNSCGENLAALLSALDETNELPRTILFSLDETDFNIIGTIIGAFQNDEIPGKLQLGAAWWFLDTRDGMEKQMRSLASLGLLGTFTGMLTDSRSFLSYTRHDYFRRIFCNLIGKWVEDGEYPEIEASLKKIVEGVSFGNARNYFEI